MSTFGRPPAGLKSNQSPVKAYLTFQRGLGGCLAARNLRSPRAPGKPRSKVYPGVGHTAADMTTRCAFKIEDPSRGPRRVDFTAQDEGFCLEAVPEPKIRRDPSPPKGNLICGPPLYPGRGWLPEETEGRHGASSRPTEENETCPRT